MVSQSNGTVFIRSVATSSGTVRSIDDIGRLRYMPNINGAIISRALITGQITLREALQVAAEKSIAVEVEDLFKAHGIDIRTGVAVSEFLAEDRHVRAMVLFTLTALFALATCRS